MRLSPPPRRGAIWWAAVCGGLVSSFCGVHADEEAHLYELGESVTVWTDKLGPYNNPQETYSYAMLGLCELEGDDIEVEDREATIGEALEGHALSSTPRIKLKFAQDTPRVPVCNMVLDSEGAEELASYINDNYWYNLYIDDLAVWAFVGEHSRFGVDVSRIQRLFTNGSKSHTGGDAKSGAPPAVPLKYKGKPLPRIYTHRRFTLHRSQSQVIEVDMEPSEPWPVYDGAPLNFSFSAVWYSTSKPFEERELRYLDPGFFEHKVHWFSIINSFMVCLFLVTVVAIILMKTLKRDFTKYSATEAEELQTLDGGGESGWKQVSGDVFRRPERLAMFTVFYATGIHIMATVFLTLLFAIMHSFYLQRGATATSFILSYLCTIVVGAFEGGRVFSMFGGQHWKRTMMYQCLFGPGIIFVSFVIINTTAIMYGATMTMPFKTMALIGFLFMNLCVPLNTFGTLLGRRAAAGSAFPCRVHHLKRPIPAKHWLFTPGMMAVAGVVPFGCLFIEMYFILSAVWSHNRIYYVYGFMLAILVLLCVVVICVSITCTYVLLNAEDYRWQWQTFLSCASTSFYVFLYIVHYFHSTHMSGLFQTVYYFGVSLNFCIGLALFSGALGFIGASRFVFLIYRNIKAE